MRLLEASLRLRGQRPPDQQLLFDAGEGEE